MALIERITQEELALYEIVRNPVLFAEFFLNIDKVGNDELLLLTKYQKEFMSDFNSRVSLCCSRAVGKTFAISAMIVWALVFNVFPEDYIVYTVPSKVHLEPVFTNLIRLFRTNSLLKNFIRSSGGINSSDFTIELLNKSKLMCRIAGQSGTGNNVIGLHTPFVFVDEGGYYPWGAWTEMQPIVNTWTKGYRVLVSGVPTGVREKNVLFHVDQENSQYTKHRVNSYANPRFSQKDEQRALEQYGGRDSDDFLHFVLGLHGHPVYSLFDRANFQVDSNEVYQLVLNGLETKENIGDYITKLAMIPVLPPKTNCVFGIDLGYTEPTAIIIMTLDKEDRFRFHARIKLEKVSYPIQEKLIDRLDTIYKPMLMGIDRGNAGIGVIQNLMENDQYADKKYKTRIIPVDFSSWTTLGMDGDGNEVKQKTKPLATQILQDWSNQHKIIYSYKDVDMIVELERMTYTRTPSGDIVYRTMGVRGGVSKSEDHFTAALLCMTLAYFLTTDLTFKRAAKRVKLIGFSWIGG